jgi:hypothetical protein
VDAVEDQPVGPIDMGGPRNRDLAARLGLSDDVQAAAGRRRSAAQARGPSIISSIAMNPNQPAFHPELELKFFFIFLGCFRQ